MPAPPRRAWPAERWVRRGRAPWGRVRKARARKAWVRKAWARKAWAREVAGLGSVVALALAYLSPALKDGFAFGTFDFVIPLTSLGRGVGNGRVHNHVNSDVVSQMNAWMSFDWHQVHAGHFPLWNDLSLLGLPQFLNFQSSVLSLPDLVAYAVPFRYAFITAVLVKLLLAGTGAYVLGRVLGLGPLGASFAGATFMLSGAFANWLSWPLDDVVCWFGWIAAFALLSFRRPGRARFVTLLGVTVAFAGYGGFPEANLFLAVALVVMVVVAGAAVGVSRVGPSPARSLRAAVAGLARVVLGAIAGILLAAPLWWPGLQVLHLSHRTTETAFLGLPYSSLPLVLTNGFYGLPIGSNHFFLHGWNYYETAAYVGIVVLALAVVAVAVQWRRPAVLALVGLVVVGVAISYAPGTVFHPVQSLLSQIDSQVEWSRFRSLLGLPLGLLGGIGLETAVRQWRSRRAFVSFAIASGVLAALVGALAAEGAPPLAGAARVRTRSLVWPAALAATCLLVSVGWGLALRAGERPVPRPPVRRRVPRRQRRGRRSPGLPGLRGIGLWGASAAFLLFAGVGINAYASKPFPGTAAIRQLSRLAGGGLVGLDSGRPRHEQQFSPVGLYPEVNVGYGIAEFAAHDPALPERYFDLLAPNLPPGGPSYLQPDIATARLARAYGIGYVLAAPYVRSVPGGRLLGDIAGEHLYSIPHSRRFSLDASAGALGRLQHPDASEYDLSVSVKAADGEVLARLTPMPGWHLTVDGRPRGLSQAGAIGYTFSVPPGRHRIRLWYWPARLTEGISAAVLGALLLLVSAAASVLRQRGLSRGQATGAAPREGPMI